MIIFNLITFFLTFVILYLLCICVRKQESVRVRDKYGYWDDWSPYRDTEETGKRTVGMLVLILVISIIPILNIILAGVTIGLFIRQYNMNPEYYAKGSSFTRYRIEWPEEITNIFGKEI